MEVCFFHRIKKIIETLKRITFYLKFISGLFSYKSSYLTIQTFFSELQDIKRYLN